MQDGCEYWPRVGNVHGISAAPVEIGSDEHG